MKPHWFNVILSPYMIISYILYIFWIDVEDNPTIFRFLPKNQALRIYRPKAPESWPNEMKTKCGVHNLDILH